ncbi:MAG TPA: J domain-containing protein [Clostridia bacterium]|nr:J domain-containing protein [Clostridia bacterium]
MADHYEVLQVAPRAEPEVIRAAFRALARKYHPDFGGDPRRMMELNEAWTVLGDRERRAAYDASRVRSRSRLAGGAPRQRRTPPVGAEAAPMPSNPIAEAADPPAQTPAEPPPGGRPAGTVLDFGRYAGWSVGALAGHDPDYLLWLERTPIGRPLRTEIGDFMERRRAASASAGPATPARRGGLLSRQRAG